MSLLKLFNIIFQFSFMRLACVKDINTGGVTKYKILKWIVPGTGWISNYIYIGKK